MSFDLNKTLSLIKGGLFDAENNWTNYLSENPSWQQTALVLTAPLLLANVILSLIFYKLVGGFAIYGYQSGWLLSLFLGLLTGVISVAITASVFNIMAGVFKGTSNFSRAFTAVSLAVIPAWVAGAVSPLIPFLGVFLALAGGILSLVYMYRIMPLALAVPAEKRVMDFIASLLLIIVVNAVLGMIFAPEPETVFTSGDYASETMVETNISSAGMMGEITRQAQLMEVANADQYQPPADGELDEAQVVAYISVLDKTRSIHQEYAKKMDQISADIEAKEESGEGVSFSDISQAMSGAGSMIGANNAEMEVLKTGGGNWAEHQWVKQQLRTARYQQGEGSDAVAHNYKLYQKYEEQLTEQ